jgi:uncharacterized ion transporter superfamily protein YfcC
MRIKEIVGAASALALSSVPAMAQAVDRASESASSANSIAGMSTLLLVALVVALGVGIFLIVDDGNSDSP